MDYRPYSQNPRPQPSVRRVEPEKARSSDAKKQTGNYPMPDKGHAISAKRLSRKQLNDGNLSKAEFERINRKADKVIKAESKK